jgi:hypothetical protein
MPVLEVHGNTLNRPQGSRLRDRKGWVLRACTCLSRVYSPVIQINLTEWMVRKSKICLLNFILTHV